MLGLLGPVFAGARPEALNIEVVPGLALAFKVEPLGMLFALVASGLWIVNSIYSIGYMRGNDEPRQTSYYVCFAVALGCTIGIAFAKNLFTLFLFYEGLTLSTYPARHPQGQRRGDPRRAASTFFFSLAPRWCCCCRRLSLPGRWPARSISRPAASSQGKASGAVIGLLLALYAFGIGKAALMPLHFWLPAAMVAPTPVSALLHAVAVVKAGVFTIVKVVVYVFGTGVLAGNGAADWLVYLASASLLLASLVALTRDNLKARLAYSTVSQLAYVVLGASLANATSIIGSGLHIATHAVGKITLFFCAGAIYTALHKTEISEMTGIGRKMPITMTAFLIGSLSIIGLPPFAGTWSKWTLALGALDAGHAFVVGVLMVSSVLSAAYLLPIVARAFFLPSPSAGGGTDGLREAPAACVIALCLTAFLCLVLFFQAGNVQTLLEGIFAPQQR